MHRVRRWARKHLEPHAGELTFFALIYAVAAGLDGPLLALEILVPTAIIVGGGVYLIVYGSRK